MSSSPNGLSVEELAQRCRQESEKYLAGQPHDETYCFELFRRAIFNRDQAAWQAIYAQYQTLITSWVWRHSKFQSTNEEAASFVNAAFIRFWRTVSKKGMGQFLATLVR
jgi:hypothetical protein